MAENPTHNEPPLVPSCEQPATMAELNTAGEQSLAEIGARIGVDKITYHHYHHYYAGFLDGLRHREGGLLEIGIDQGLSLQMWLAYFSRAFVYGIDINISAEGERHRIFKADQNDIPKIRQILQQDIHHPVFLVVDDGSHMPEHQARTFDLLFRELLLPGGVYVIEDVEVSYWSRGELYGYRTRYGYRHPASIIEVFKTIADDLNNEYLTDASRYAQAIHLKGLVSGEAREMVSSVCFGKNCIIITKKSQEESKIGRQSYFYAQYL